MIKRKMKISEIDEEETQRRQFISYGCEENRILGMAMQCKPNCKKKR